MEKPLYGKAVDPICRDGRYPKFHFLPCVSRRNEHYECDASELRTCAAFLNRYHCVHCGMKHQAFCDLLVPMDENASLAELAKRLCLRCVENHSPGGSTETQRGGDGDPTGDKERKRRRRDLRARGPSAPDGSRAKQVRRMR